MEHHNYNMNLTLSLSEANNYENIKFRIQKLKMRSQSKGF